MNYSTDSDSKSLSILTHPTQPATSLESEILQEITAIEYKRHAGDRCRNHGQNLIFSTAFQVVQKQKEFKSAAAEEFGRVFTTQTSKLVEDVKAQKEKQKVFLPQLPPPLKESKLCSFPNENGASKKMTGTEAAVAAEADRTQACRKAEKEKNKTEKYRAEFAALCTDSSSPPPGPLSSPFSVVAQGLPESQSPPRIPDFSSSIHVVSTDSDSDVNETSFPLVPKLPSPTPRQSRRTRKPTRKLESQQRREAEEESEPKRQKIRKSKIDVSSQLKEYLGSDIEQ